MYPEAGGSFPKEIYDISNRGGSPRGERPSNVGLYANDQWAAEATEVLLGSANAQPNHLQYGVFSEAMWAGLESVWTGSKSAADAVNDLESELSSKLGDDLLVR